MEISGGEKKELLLTLFDEAEIENDCLRDSPQKDGGSRQEITVNLSPHKSKKVGSEQRAPVAFNKIKIVFLNLMYSFIVLYVYGELKNSIQIFISVFQLPQTNRDFTSAAAAALFVFTDWLSPPFGAESMVHGGFFLDLLMRERKTVCCCGQQCSQKF